ncbi:MAG: hypothetical protein V1918_03390 [Planctomycetota bacterium]
MARDREFFEVLVQKRASERAARQAKAALQKEEPPGDAPRPSQKRREPRRAPELVLSLEAGIGVLLAVGVMVGAAYLLGERVGRRNAVGQLGARMRAEEARIHPPAELPAGTGLRETRREAYAWPSESYVLKLITYGKTPRGRTQALGSRDFARSRPIVGELGLSVEVLETDKAYSVCLGAVLNRNDPRLEQARQVMSRLTGDRYAADLPQPPYAGCRTEQATQLGTVVR